MALAFCLAVRSSTSMASLVAERVRGPRVGGKHVYSGNQVRKEGGNQYLDMVSAIESEVAELHSSTATGAPL